MESNGETAVGIRYKTGVVLAVEKNIKSSLVDENSVRKIQKISEHVGATYSGLSGDFRVLANISDVRTRPIDITGLKENATINTTVIIPAAASASERKVTVRIVIQADPSVNPNKPPIP